MPDQNYAYLGTATDFPITIENGTYKVVGGPQVIENSIIMILTTPKGSRYWLPEYGCNVSQIMWEPNDAVLARLVQHTVMEALNTWEPRAYFQSVEVLPVSDAMLCNIVYRIKNSDEIQSFVFPFKKTISR